MSTALVCSVSHRPASVSITLDVYSHLLPDMQERTAKALEETLQ